MKTIRGKIIKIPDRETVVINLGERDGIKSNTLFTIFGEPEDVVDPESNEVLGKIQIKKKQVKASLVAEKYTIAKSIWTTYNFPFATLLPTDTAGSPLNVDSSEIDPWESSNKNVFVGDYVEAHIPEDSDVDTTDTEEDSKDK